MNDSKITAATLDSALRRIFLTRFRLGEFEASTHPYSSVNESVVDSTEHRQLARDVASASVILAKNSGSLLPLKTSAMLKKTIAVVGPYANCGDCYLHSYNGHPSYIISYLDAVTEIANITGAVVQSSVSTTANVSQAVAAVQGADLVVVVLGLGQAEHEGYDRTVLTFPEPQPALLSAVRQASAGKPLVLLSVSAGPVAVDPSLADAILFVGYGGQEAGHGATDIMFGRVSPSGRFPVTVYEEDYINKVGPLLDYSSTSGVGR